jgi:Holliday junction DNA helicase RuvB
MIGHENTKKQLAIAMNAAKKDNRNIPHTLFAGAAGCGKTSMSKRVAADAKVAFIKVAPDDLKDLKSIKLLLKKLDHSNYNDRGDRIGAIKPSIIFIDEIHRMSVQGQEILGIAMEEFELESDRLGKKYWLPYFTVIGATTNDGMLTKPFRDRFKIKILFQPYHEEEIQEIVKLKAEEFKQLITPKAVRSIAKRARGIPRIVIGYFERARDRALMYNAKVITSEIADRTFEAMGIDDNGLTRVDLKILRALRESKTALGIENLAVITNEAAKTIAESAEPFLIQQGFIIRGGKGRTITEKGIQYLEANDDNSRIDIDIDYKRT